MKAVSHFGPMHGERTRRHQFVGKSSRGDELIVTTYEVRDYHDEGEPPADVEIRLAVEFYRPTDGVMPAWLSVAEAGWLRDALDEFVVAYGEAPDAWEWRAVIADAPGEKPWKELAPVLSRATAERGVRENAADDECGWIERRRRAGDWQRLDATD